MQLPRPSGNLGRTKNILHFAQGFIIFLAWALTIAIWTKGDGIDGRTVWYWILVRARLLNNTPCPVRLGYVWNLELVS
jgi:hypothetical protein